MRLLLLAAAWIGGVWLGLEADFRPAAIYVLLAACLTLGLCLFLLRWRLFPVAVVALLLLGAWRADSIEFPAQPLTTADQQQVLVTGIIAADPGATSRQVRFELEVSGIDRGDGNEEASGRLLVYAAPPAELAARRPSPHFRYGDVMTIQGTLQRPQPIDGFDYPKYLAARGIGGILFASEVEAQGEAGDGWREGIYDIRRRLSESLKAALPSPQSSLSQALLLGQRASLPQGLEDRFRDTGASHLLAISGLHVGVLMVVTLGASALLLGRRRRMYLIVPLIVIWAYAVVAGGSPSALRAAAMGTVYLAALALGRPNSVLPALGLAAIAMTAVSPGLLQRVGFQLSFAAVAGISLAHSYFSAYEPDRAANEWRWMLRPLLGLAVVSAAAALATWPLVAFYFDSVGLMSIPVTLLAVPAMPLVLVGSMAAALAGVIHPALGEFVGFIVWAPLTYLIGVVSVFPAWTWQPEWAGKWLAVGWYGGLGLLLLMGRPRQPAGFGTLIVQWSKSVAAFRPPPRRAGVIAVAAVALAVGASMLWLRVASTPDGLLHVQFFDVGQGDSALITTPSGRRVLVDGGPDWNSAIDSLADAGSSSGRTLDLVVLTHLDADHSRGLLNVLERYRIGGVLEGKESRAASMYAQWQSELRRQEITPINVYRGYEIVLGGGVTLEVLNPRAAGGGAETMREADSNNDGVVVRLTYGSVSFLLTADIESATERKLVNGPDILASDVLKVAHHGSRTSSTEEFLAAVAPAVAVVSAGQDNPFGHPSPAVTGRLETNLGASGVFRTDRDGDVEFVTDGTSLWVRTEL